MATEMTTGLTLDDIHHSYDGEVVVRGVSLSVHPGEVVSLLGPSGCGKTTCLRIAAGLERVQTGVVGIDGTTVAAPDRHTPPEVRSVGLVLQDYALFPHLDVVGNVAFGLRRKRLSRAECAHRAMAILERVGLAHLAGNFPHQLSGGEQQRVALARALAPEPRVMLMDEPFSGLDVTLRDRVRDNALAVLKDLRVPTLLVTHDPEEAMRMSDRIAVMKGGGILQTGTPEDIYFRPRCAEVVTFFGELNRFETVVASGRAPTAIGDIPAPGLAEGTAVEVLVRPQAFRLRESSGDTEVTAQAVVVRSQLLGPACLIDLRLGKSGLMLRARAATRDLPEQGSTVRLFLHPRDVFVFARSGV